MAARILVAEDDDEMLALLTVTLENAGYQVFGLEDGLELSDALELINTRTATRHQPELVITDVRMPGRSGLDVVRAAREVGLSCPVLVLSAFADQAVVEAAAQLGRTVVLSKPVDLEVLIATVDRLVRPDPAPPGARVLVVDDSDEMRLLLREALERRGCLVEEASDGLQMTARLVADQNGQPAPDVVITDVRMPWSGGLDVLERLRGFGWKTRFIVMTAFGDRATHARALQLGAAQVFDKPFMVDQVVEATLRLARGRPSV